MPLGKQEERPQQKYLYIKKDGRIVIRFVGDQEILYQYFREPSPVTNQLQASLSIIDAMASHQKSFFKSTREDYSNYHVSKRIVSLVIDRLDNDRIKAFCCPVTVWNEICDISNDNNCDFEINRTGTGLSTRYTTKVSDDNTQITEEQSKIVEATLKTFSLEDIFIHKRDEWQIQTEIHDPIENRFDILDL